MKKFSVIISLLLAVALIAGCSGGQKQTVQKTTVPSTLDTQTPTGDVTKSIGEADNLTQDIEDPSLDKDLDSAANDLSKW